MTRAAETIVAEGTFFDGASARPHPVTLRLGERLEIAGSGWHQSWNLMDIRASETEFPTMRLSHEGQPARIEFTDAALARTLTARCPDLHKNEDGQGGILKFVAWSVAAGVSVLLVAIYGVPYLAGLIAPMIPPSVERQFGASVDGQVVRLLNSPPLCDDRAAKAVLDRLVARMTEGAGLVDQPFVVVRRHDLANALTLPGGRVIVLSDLIDKAKTPDEFAGVLAHEFGHVAARDPTRGVITAGGTSFLLSLILGDLTGSTVIVALGQSAISAGYSRDAERAADAYAVEMMRRVGGDETALATILERITAGESEEKDVTSFMRSHPYTKERAATIRATASKDSSGRRVMSEADWQTLRAICPTKAGTDEKKKGENPPN